MITLLFGFNLITNFVVFVLLVYICLILAYHLFSSSTLFVNWCIEVLNVFLVKLTILYIIQTRQKKTTNPKKQKKNLLDHYNH
jgi:membrane protein implicated in regulation of membrane protease activity